MEVERPVITIKYAPLNAPSQGESRFRIEYDSTDDVIRELVECRKGLRELLEGFDKGGKPP